ncbi:MAG: hypothetical protein K8F25_09880 [Fimbriimonadaceae bacterium]|nr:hypothetical protein [Alphaproteobacteria bacterium]
MSLVVKFITLSFFSGAALLALSTPLLAYSGEYFYVCNLNPRGDNYLSLRTCGSTKCPEILRMGPGMVLTSLEPYAQNGWREVVVRGYAQDDTDAGTVGWVFSKYICSAG